MEKRYKMKAKVVYRKWWQFWKPCSDIVFYWVELIEEAKQSK